MDINKLCMRCMQILNDNEEYCPHCGNKVGESNSSRGLQPQTILNDKYLVGMVIGEGGFGITYIAYDLVLKKRVAIKEYFPSELVTRDTSNGTQTELTVLTGHSEEQYQKGIERFFKEASNLAKFNHLEGIVSVKEFFYENNTAYMVMDYIDGITLSQYLENNGGKLPYTKVLDMMAPVMESLEKVHEAGVIHRDISPDNIMVSKSGDVKLIDFGAARIVDNNDAKSLTVVLKHGYAPEEQYQQNGNQGPWTDVYALAATMYRMITGIIPQESTERVLSGDKVVLVNKLEEDVPKKISDAIMRGLAIYVKNRPQNISDFYGELEKGNKKVQSFYACIAGVLASLTIIVGIILVSNNVEKSSEVDGNNTLSVDQYSSSNEIYDENRNVEAEKSEEYLIFMIEEKSGQKVAFSEYEDFNEDGNKELYSLTIPYIDGNDIAEESGQIWYADTEKAVKVMETRLNSTYMYSSNSQHGLLHFGKTVHFYLESRKNGDDLESLSFGVVDGNPQLVFQGNAKFADSANGVVLKNQHTYDKYSMIYQQGDCKVLYISGQYFGCGLSPLSMAQFNSIPGIDTEFVKAMNQLKGVNESYPYKVFENVYYSADDCIYINTICLRSEEDYDDYVKALHRVSNLKRELEDIDYIKCALVFTCQSGRVCFSEITEIVPAETTKLALFYKVADFWNKNSEDIQKLSDEETKKILMHRLYEYFQMQDEEFRELLWDDNSELVHVDEFSQWEVSGSILGDFDNDGSKELMAFVNATTDEWYHICGIYCIGNDGIVTMCQGKGTIMDTQLRGITEYKFGKKQMYGLTVEQQLWGESLLYEPIKGGVIRYDQLWSMGENSPNIGSNDEGIIIGTYGDVVYNKKTGKIQDGGLNQMADSYIDPAKIWFVDGRFVECASIRIDEDNFLKFEGAKEIIDHIDEYALEILRNNRTNDFYGTDYLYDFGIDSILYCGDGYIYVNYLPIKNHDKYGWVDTYNEGFINTLPSVCLKIELSENKVKLCDIYGAYKLERVTNFQPYYPQNTNMIEGGGDNINIGIDQHQKKLNDYELPTEVRGGDTIYAHVIVDDNYEFRYGIGRAIILRLDNPVELHYISMEDSESVWPDFSDDLFVTSEEVADGGWNQYNGKLIKCRVNSFIEATTGGMIVDVDEILEVIE